MSQQIEFSKQEMLWDTIFSMLRYAFFTILLFIFVNATANMFLEVLPKYCSL